MDDDLSTQLITQTKGIWKYRWSAIIVAWVIAIAGWMVVYRMPDEFQASARIHVDTGNVLKPLMQGMTVAPDMEKQLIIMTRTLISRPNVERIARMVDPDFESKTKKDQQNKVSSLMSKIILTNIGTDNLYTISYNSSDRELARNVVQSSLDIFMEENNDSDSNSTSAIRFIDEQIDVYEKKLVTQEEELKKFQQKNVGFMPQQAQGGSYYKQLGAAEEELKKTKLELREAEHARDSIKKQITGDEPVLI
ncbi:MAG: chain length-determining protein, partial [Nitrosomonadales bacterium]